MINASAVPEKRALRYSKVLQWSSDLNRKRDCQNMGKSKVVDNAIFKPNCSLITDLDAGLFSILLKNENKIFTAISEHCFDRLRLINADPNSVYCLRHVGLLILAFLHL